MVCPTYTVLILTVQYEVHLCSITSNRVYNPIRLHICRKHVEILPPLAANALPIIPTAVISCTTFVPESPLRN